ncbi:estradiol 17-beta-dehydrogenase 1 isoform X1 [Cyprinus carpio]|uniref:Estradiol 17-beta-dehydrogenase 1 isoform X1 n=3 Tax=Cyprinus carpio TaxID=7962 RepID=A0A8C1V5H9_CYPCA|nr:estradiol 17-beta-dehydrogenase 1 isoform X1 [Cyprinus carpio]
MEQKVVLITGCSSGIGLSLAVHLASNPSKAYKVYATMRNLDKKQRLMESVRGLHKDTMAILQMDVTDQKSILDAKRNITEGRIDILVCNAGVGLMGPLEAHSLDTIHAVLDVNLLGTLRTIQTFLPDMKRKRHGRILVTGSMGGLQGLPFNEVYCASKFAVEGACESLAILLQHFNIHVSLIECGPVNTDFLMNLKRTEPSEEALEVDAHTRSLYDQYLQHCQAVFQNAAQDTEDIIQVYKEAIEAQTPFLRYYTNRALLPMCSLKLTSMDGSQYIRAMSKLIFSAPNTDPQI